jgi:glycosyltransferase involved in cell wall biosynthesis
VPPSSILIFEPRGEGHHIPWLGMVAGALRQGGHRVAAALDEEASPQRRRIEDAFPGLLGRITCVSALERGRFRGRSPLAAAAECLNQTGADAVLVNNLDEFASAMLRRAALGRLPPRVLRGRMIGIYHRPRPLDPTQRGPGPAWKRAGLRRLARAGWLAGLGILDEFLLNEARPRWPDLNLHWLPDFWRGDGRRDAAESRAALGVPGGAVSFLAFGVGHRRKGIDLVVEAARGMDRAGSMPAPWTVLAAGRQPDPSVAAGLRALERAGRAVVLDRYVSDLEVSQAFAASDFVLLPYRSHYGSSNVLSLAAAAGRPVIASDHHLIGRRVREHGLGFVFRDRDASDLRAAMERAAAAGAADLEAVRRRALEYARGCSPAAFGAAVRALVGAA